MTDTTTTDTSPVIEVAEAVAETVATPTIPVLAEDLILVHRLVSDVKTKLAGKSATLASIFSILFNL